MRFGKIALMILGMTLAAYAADDPFIGTWESERGKIPVQSGRH